MRRSPSGAESGIVLNAECEALDELKDATIRMSEKGMGIPDTEAAVVDKT